MDQSTEIILILGALLLAGLAMETLARRIRLPRVTLLLFVGFLIGPSIFNLIPNHVVTTWFPPLTNIALAMIGFLLGSKMTWSSLKKIGRYVLGISIVVVIITFICVFVGLMLIHVKVDIALLLAGLSAATAPAATSDVVFELKAKGIFSRVLLDIVAIDDAWTLILFSITMIVVHFMQGQSANISFLLLKIFWEIFGALIIGIILGIPMAYLSGRIRPGEPTLLEALGIVFVGCGVALALHVSFILALMVLGTVVANLAKHHQRTFHAIEGIEWPFMVLFFILAGSQFNLKMMSIAGLIGFSYIILRLIGRIIGGWLGSRIVHADKIFQRWIGLALMPQAGLAIGMGLIAIQTYPNLEKEILPVVLSSTVVFEIVGPILTRKALIKSGEVK